MNLTTILPLSALAGALVLLFNKKAWPAPAVVTVLVAAIEVLLAFRILSLNLARLPLPLILGGALAVLGIMLLSKVSARAAVAAATVVAFVGVIQVLVALRLG